MNKQLEKMGSFTKGKSNWKPYLCAAIFALAFDGLFFGCIVFDYPAGLNVLMMIALYYVCLWIVAQDKLCWKQRETIWLIPCIVAFALPFCLYNNPIILWLNAIALVLTVSAHTAILLRDHDAPPYTWGFIGDTLRMLMMLVRKVIWPPDSLQGAKATKKGVSKRDAGDACKAWRRSGLYVRWTTDSDRAGRVDRRVGG